MPLILKSPMRYIQGKDALANIGPHISGVGKKFLVLCSAGTTQRIGGRMRDGMRRAGLEPVFYPFGGRCTEGEIAGGVTAGRALGCDAVIGAGGGSAADTAKAVADRLGLPLVVVPTAASCHAFCTATAMIRLDGGVVEERAMRRGPEVVLADTQIIAEAPVRCLLSGVGDALSTWFEARCVYGASLETPVRGRCSNAALAMACLSYDILRKEAPKALADAGKRTVTFELENVVEACIYLSGVGSESGGAAAARAICNALGQIPGMRASYGERTAFGTLVHQILERVPQQEFQNTMTLMLAVGLPVTLAQMGPGPANTESIRKVAEAACAPGGPIKNLPFPVSPEQVYNAIMEADLLGTRLLE